MEEWYRSALCSMRRLNYLITSVNTCERRMRRVGSSEPHSRRILSSTLTHAPPRVWGHRIIPIPRDPCVFDCIVLLQYVCLLWLKGMSTFNCETYNFSAQSEPKVSHAQVWSGCVVCDWAWRVPQLIKNELELHNWIHPGFTTLLLASSGPVS